MLRVVPVTSFVPSQCAWDLMGVPSVPATVLSDPSSLYVKVSLWISRLSVSAFRVSILMSVAVCLITSVTGPMGTAWCADSLRVGSIFHVPEKSATLWAHAGKGGSSAIVNIAIAIRAITRYLDASIPKPHSASAVLKIPDAVANCSTPVVTIEAPILHSFRKVLGGHRVRLV